MKRLTIILVIGLFSLSAKSQKFSPTYQHFKTSKVVLGKDTLTVDSLKTIQDLWKSMDFLSKQVINQAKQIDSLKNKIKKK